MGEDVDTARFWSCTRRKMSKCRPTLLRWQLLSKDMRSNVWGPKRRSTCSQALIDNIQSASDHAASGREISRISTWRNIVNIKAEIVFAAGTKNVFKNAVNFGAPAASILQGS